MMIRERRASRRYELSFPIVVRVTHLERTTTHVGRTRDISTQGVHFFLPVDLHPGIAIEFTITMPRELTGGSRVFIRGTGRVLWAAGCRDNSYGITSAIEQYDISREQENSGFSMNDVT
jgi:hypothetical protein